MNTLTDTHCHLYFDAFDNDRDNVLKEAWNAGLERILVPGIDLVTSQDAIRLAEKNLGVYAAVGVHPNDGICWDESMFNKLQKLAGHAKVVAIGEIGLDYYWDRTPRDVQHEIFREQLTLAEILNLPVVIHTRNKNEQDRQCIKDTLAILSEFRNRIFGVLHSFSGNLSELEQTLDLGFHIGITGPVTFSKAHDLRRLIKSLPLERLLIETDSPFLTPHPHRGKRNQPSYVALIAEKIAHVLDRTTSEIAKITTANANHLFQWS